MEGAHAFLRHSRDDVPRTHGLAKIAIRGHGKALGGTGEGSRRRQGRLGCGGGGRGSGSVLPESRVRKGQLAERDTKPVLAAPKLGRRQHSGGTH